MRMEMLGIVLSNAILLLTAVWRISSQLSKITTEIIHINEKMNMHKSAIELRISSLEERVVELERNQLIRLRKDNG